MSGAELPAAVRTLLRGPVSSMAHVEALLLLREVEPEARLVPEVAAAAQLATLAAARRCLEELAAAGLVAVAGDGYRYTAAATDTRAAVDALAQMYNERPVTLVRAIYSRAASVQAFADAFRLRRDEE